MGGGIQSWAAATVRGDQQQQQQQGTPAQAAAARKTAAATDQGYEQMDSLGGEGCRRLNQRRRRRGSAGGDRNSSSSGRGAGAVAARVCTCIVVWLATERASLRYCYEAGLQVKVVIPQVDLQHVVNGGSNKLTEGLLCHSLKV
uniref:Uncharacterized protein n=2 Tax=Oryza sativa subsp. japonica TaxID=39947 RepID=Q2R805_ORYSJ|nr:hypothetical protein LOC_Os11g14320 [Oryza sativa Japonica Group]AAX96753.1 hypothetical protein [Oryza sativa Japonica Group]ABA92364.1 hypothetical protein LOC_Os11g14320 [Oryza sativa Japonica Group]